MYIVVGVVIVLAVLAAVLVSLSLKPAGAPSGKLLAPQGASYGIQASQFVAFGFIVNASSTLTGSVTTTFNVSIYLMSSVEFAQFVSTTVVGHAEWASGTIASGPFSTPVGPGDWELVFLDPSTIQATNVVFTAPVQVTSP